MGCGRCLEYCLHFLFLSTACRKLIKILSYVVFCALQEWVTRDTDVHLCVAQLHTGHWNVTDGRWVVRRVATGGGVELGKARRGQPCHRATLPGGNQ